jgi:hypothetical protein
MRHWSTIFAVAGLMLLMFGILSLGYVNLYRSSAGPPRGTIWIYTASPYSGLSDIRNYEINDVFLTLVIWPNASGRLELEFAVTIFSERQFGFGILQPFSVVKGYPMDDIEGLNPPFTDDVGSNGESITTIWFKPKLGFTRVGFALVISNPFSNVEIGRRTSYLPFFRGRDVAGNQRIADLTYGLDASPVLNYGLITFTVNFPTEWYLSLTETLPSPDKSFSVEDYNAAYWRLDLKRPPVNLAETITVTMVVPSEITLRDRLNFFGAFATALGAGVFSSASLQVLDRRERRRILRHTSIEQKDIDREL